MIIETDTVFKYLLTKMMERALADDGYLFGLKYWSTIIRL